MIAPLKDPTPYDGAVRIRAPGIYDMTAALYHADPCAKPSLSHSVSKVLVGRSAMHARHAHPRFTEQEEREVNAAMDFGSAIHKLLLGKGEHIAVVPFKDYKKKEAQRQRDSARAEGHIPILTDAMTEVSACAEAVERQLRQREDWADFFGHGWSEVVLIWREGDIYCRGMVDRLSATGRMYDLKSTNLSAAPWGWERRMQEEYATQCAFYRRGMNALGVEDPQPMLFAPFEQSAPFGLSSVCADSILMSWADMKVTEALSAWATCQRTGKWPGYPLETTFISARGWMMEEIGDIATATASAKAHHSAAPPGPDSTHPIPADLRIAMNSPDPNLPHNAGGDFING